MVSERSLTRIPTKNSGVGKKKRPWKEEREGPGANKLQLRLVPASNSNT